jgi:hypothetical protein
VKGELAKAYIIAKSGMDISRESIVAHCREHLAAYKIPRAVQFVEQVPMTSPGKMMRRLLKDLDDGTRQSIFGLAGQPENALAPWLIARFTRVERAAYNMPWVGPNAALIAPSAFNAGGNPVSGAV